MNSDVAEKMHFLVLERIDSARNMDRYYVLSVEPTLFPGDFALVREWGRTGVSMRRRLDLFKGRKAAVSSLKRWLRKKKQKGYRVRGESELADPVGSDTAF